MKPKKKSPAAQLPEDLGPLPLIQGPTCPSCGRVNFGYHDICTSDDCPGVQKYAAAPDLLAALKKLAGLADGRVNGDDNDEMCAWAEALLEAQEAIRKAC